MRSIAGPPLLQYSGWTRSGRYYRARYYHPGLQRFISEDPLGFAAGDPNLYAYVGNNPIDRRDPLGLEWQLSLMVNALAGGGPLLNGPFIGGGMGFAITSNGQLVLQLQATGAYGVGLYAGVGLQGGVSKTRCPTPDELSVQHAAQADLNVAIPPYSFGGSAQYDLDGGGGVQTPIPKVRVGAGAGAQASLGVTQTVNIPLTPKLFGRKPTPGCQ